MSTSSWKPIQHIHLTEQVYEAVRDRIMNRTITINQQINVEEIAEELEVSRTPVMEAIKRLANEGLVEIKARRGTFVRGITEHDVNEIFMFREALELFALRHVIENNLTEKVVSKMKGNLQQMAEFISDNRFTDYAAFTEQDREFHCALIEACQARRISDAYQNLNIHLQIMRGHFFKGLEPPMRVHRDHSNMVKAIARKDAIGAEKILREHLKTIRVGMLQNVQQAGGVL